MEKLSLENQPAKQLLKDPGQLPEDSLFKEILIERLYQSFQGLQQLLSAMGIQHEWRFYKDGNAWLCKIMHKKKTVAWLSLWENGIKTTFYFTEKTRDGIMSLEIDDSIKTSFLHAKLIGKLIPLSLKIEHPKTLNDFKNIAVYKMSIK